MFKEFEDRFEADGAGYLYRHTKLAAPISVSRFERETFVEDFKRRIRLIFWGMIAGMAPVALILLPFLDSIPFTEENEIYVQIGTGVFCFAYLILFFVLFHWALTAPARALKARQPKGQPRSKDEVNRKHFSELGYGTIAMVGLGLLLVIGLRIDLQNTLFSGMNLVWVMMAALAIAFTIYTVLQKARYDKRK